MNLSKCKARNWIKSWAKTELALQGVDVISTAKDAQLVAPETLEIRYSKGASEESVLTELTDKVKRFTGKEPKLVGVSADHDPGTYEIWFSKP